MLNRLIQKWYKYQQAKSKTFDSHWYMRFGWLEQPFTSLEQLDSLFEIHSPRKFTFADSFMLMKMIVILSSLKKLMMSILLVSFLF